MVEVDVITPLPVGWGLCSTCSIVGSQAGYSMNSLSSVEEILPRDWHEEYIRVAEFIDRLAREYKSKIMIHVFDPYSLHGLWMVLRYWTHQYPTFIINGKTKVQGYDQQAINQAICTACFEDQGLNGVME